MNEKFIEEDFERISMREKAEIAAEVNALMEEEWFRWCESKEKLPATITVKKSIKKKVK